MPTKTFQGQPVSGRPSHGSCRVGLSPISVDGGRKTSLAFPAGAQCLSSPWWGWKESRLPATWEPGGSATTVLVPKWPHAWPRAHPKHILRRRGKPSALRSRRKKAIVTQEESHINMTIKGRFLHIYSTHRSSPDGMNALCIFIPHPSFKSQHPQNCEVQPKQC